MADCGDPRGRGGRHESDQRVHPSGRQGEGDRHRPLHGRPDPDRAGARGVPLRRPHARPDHAHRHVEGARRSPACSRWSPTRTCRTSLYGGMVQDRRLFAKDMVRFEGDIVAGVAARTAEIAEQRPPLIEVDYEPLPPCTDFEARSPTTHRSSTPTGRPTRATSSLGRDGNTLGYSTIVKGDADAALAGADVVVKGRYVTDAVAGRPDRAARGDRAVAGRQGHGLDVDPGAVRRPRRRRAHAADPRVERARRRAAARRRLRRQVRLPLRRRTSPRSRGPRAAR